MPFAKVVILILISTFFEIPVITTIARCINNLDCKESEFCYTVTNFCAPCQKDFCKQLGRKESQKKCPHKNTDCGSCLDGYITEGFHEDEHPICIKIKVDNKEGINVAGHVWIYFLGGIIIILLLLIIIIMCVFDRVHKMCMGSSESSVPECNNPENTSVGSHNNTKITINNNVNENPIIDESNPLLQRCPFPVPSAPSRQYSEWNQNEVSSTVTTMSSSESNPLLQGCPFPVPSYPPPQYSEWNPNEVSSKGTNPLMHEIHHTVKETVVPNNATPFTGPNYKRSEEDAGNEASSDSDEANESYSADPPLIEDDETRESSWTPGNEQSEVTSENVTAEHTSNNDVNPPIFPADRLRSNVEEYNEEDDSNVQKSKKKKMDQ